MGRTFGLLYVTPIPLSQSEVQERLGISAGSASMTLAALVRWGVVHRVPPGKSRRELYLAETDFWKMISGVLNERERHEIRNAVSVVTRAVSEARKARARARAAARREADFVADRLERLRDICLLGETILNALLGDLRLDIGRFREVLRVPNPKGRPAPERGVP